MPVMPLMRQGQGQGDNNINYVSRDRTFITLRLPVLWYNNGTLMAPCMHSIQLSGPSAREHLHQLDYFQLIDTS